MNNDNFPENPDFVLPEPSDSIELDFSAADSEDVSDEFAALDSASEATSAEEPAEATSAEESAEVTSAEEPAEVTSAEESTTAETSAEEDPPKKKSCRKLLIALLVLLALLLCLGAAVCSYIDRTIGSINFAGTPSDGYVVSYVDIEDDDPLLSDSDYSGYPELDNSVFVSNTDAILADDPSLYYQDGTTNILVLGTDNRIVNGRGRSDAIMLVSVNRNTKQIVMNSIARDTAVMFPGKGEADKLTHGYAYGGAPLMVDTVESHFGIRIDKYAVIDFYVFIDVVDCLGGIALDITESERLWMNSYIKEINSYTNKDEHDGFLYKSGSGITVTGKQALGYVRNRYSSTETISGGDFGRNSRQRIALTAIIDKLKQNPTKVFDVFEAVAPRITTDYSQSEILSELLNADEYLSYELVSCGIPVNGSWVFGYVGTRSVVVCDFEANRREMIKNIYGTEE